MVGNSQHLYKLTGNKKRNILPDYLGNNLTDTMDKKIQKNGKSKDVRNAAERHRSLVITYAFSALENHLPNQNSEKLPTRQSKIQILDLAIKHINELDSLIKDDNSNKSVHIWPVDQVCLQGSEDQSNEMSSNDSLDTANIECIKEDSDKMYDMALYSLQHGASKEALKEPV